VREAAQAPRGERLEEAAGPRDVAGDVGGERDRLERRVAGAVDDGLDARAQARELGRVEAEAGRLEVGLDDVEAPRRAAERGVHARGGVRAVAAPREGHDGAAGREQAAHERAPDEAGGAGDEDRRARHGAGSRAGHGDPGGASAGPRQRSA